MSRIVQSKNSLTCFAVVAVEVLRKVQASNLLLKKLNTCGIYFSCSCWNTRNALVFLHVFEKFLSYFNFSDLSGDEEVKNKRETELTELQYVATSDVPISKGVCPQQAVGAGLQDVSFVVRQVFLKSQMKGIFNLLRWTWFTFIRPHGSLTAKCGGESRNGCVHLPEDAPIAGPTGQSMWLTKQFHKQPFFFLSKFLTVNFTHKQRSPQRSVTTRGSSVGDSSIQELFMDSSALWYGWGSPAPMAYTHLPKTLMRSLNFNFWRTVRTEMKEQKKKQNKILYLTGILRHDGLHQVLTVGGSCVTEARKSHKNGTQGQRHGSYSWVRLRWTEKAEKAAAEDRERMRGEKKKNSSKCRFMFPPGCRTRKKKKKVSLKC